MLIKAGVQDRVISESPTGAGTTSVQGSVNSDSLLATLWVDNVTTGSLVVSVYTLTDTGKEVLLFSFPTVVATTTNLLLKKAGVTMQRFRVEATYGGACSYEVYIRAVEGIGETSTKILGSGSLSTSSETVTTTAGILIPAALVDRNGVTLKNYSGGGTIFISEDISKLPASAWPIGDGETWSLDVDAGVTLYAVADSGTINVRIAQSGG